jgi:hypothetical protein
MMPVLARAFACLLAVVATSCDLSHEPSPPPEDGSVEPRWRTCEEYVRSRQTFPPRPPVAAVGDTCDTATFGECPTGEVFPSAFPEECSRIVASRRGGRVVEERVFGVPVPGC